jgi:hypothetical protein
MGGGLEPKSSHLLEALVSSLLDPVTNLAVSTLAVTDGACRVEEAESL